MAGITYKDAGVDVDEGDRLVDRIKPFAARTRIAEVLSGVGGFAGLCALPSGMKDPVLVSGTDGVGTKLKIAFACDRHDTIGIDLVAMCVNDILTTGARPLFFLDYFATSKLDVNRASAVIEGIANGCELAGCALLGGETAELPGFYTPGEYDLAGFAVGVVERASILDGRTVTPGDAVIGIGSSGLHSNGYSLVRKVLLEHAKLDLNAIPQGFDEPLADALLRPTRIYTRAVNALMGAVEVRALAHITGGGLPGNIPRVLPDEMGVEIDPHAWERAPVFDLVALLGEVPEHDMRRTFNLGLGLVAIVPASAAERAVHVLRESGERAWQIGRVVPTPGVDFEERVRFVSP